MSVHWGEMSAKIKADFSQLLSWLAGPRFKLFTLGDFPGGPVAKTELPKQGDWVPDLVRELDPTCRN